MHDVLSKILRPVKLGDLSTEIAGLYAVQIVQVILPIALLPFLARRLGPSEWGVLAYFQSFALLIAMVIEYGFGLSATRGVAFNRDSLPYRSKILAEVASAKLILCTVAILGTVILYSTLEQFHSHPRYVIPATIWGLSQGANMVWYYQGLGRMRDATKYEVGSRVAAAAISLLVIHGTHDGYIFLVASAVASSISTSLTQSLAYRGVHTVPLSLYKGVKGLREGFTLFLFKSSVSVYTLGNSFILGLICSPLEVGFYSGAERISKGALTLASPINQSMYAEVNRSMSICTSKAAKRAKEGLLASTSVGIALGLLIFLTAPIIVRVLLGPNFQASVGTARLMALLPPLICFSTSLGSNWMLALHLDKQFNLITLMGGGVNIFLAIVLAPIYKHLGMAIAVVASEALIAAALFLFLRISKRDPFSVLEKKIAKSDLESESAVVI